MSKDKHFTTVRVHGRTHVVTPNDRRAVTIRVNKDRDVLKDDVTVSEDEEGTIKRILIPAVNYANTGMALCGVLEKGETLEQWKERSPIV